MITTARTTGKGKTRPPCQRTSEATRRSAESGLPADPSVMVIFGASGDLTKRKLIPALYNLAKQKLLAKEFAIVGISRSEMSHEEYRKRIGEDLKEYSQGAVDSGLWNWFAERLYYLSGDLNDDESIRGSASVGRSHKRHGTKGNYFTTGHPRRVLPVIQGARPD